VMEQSVQLVRWLADPKGPPPPLPELWRLTGAEEEASSLSEEAMILGTGVSRREREALLWKAVEMFPGSSYVRTHIGNFFTEDATQHDQAVQQLGTAVMLDAENHEARLSLAGVLVAMTRFEEALVHLDRLEGHSPPRAIVTHLRGASLFELGRRDEAERAYERALEIQPRFVPALLGIAQCRRLAGDETAARKLERDAAFYGRGSPPPTR
jgi:Flp pilus assembly protein TadD